MLALGIDTSTPRVSVALADSGAVVARSDEIVGNGHGELLAVLIEQVFRAAACDRADLGAVGAGLGPGPFTGLRVGIVTVAAIADALGVPAFGVCSLDVVTPSSPSPEPYAVVTDARRRQVYWAVYDAGGRRTDGPEISPPGELAELLRGRVRHITGSAGPEHREAFADFDVDEVRWPDAGAIAMHAAACAERGDTVAPLTPLYLRRPDAREPGPPKRVTPA